MRKLFTVLSTAGLLLLCQASVSHALEIFVFIDGVQGEVTEPAHPGWSVVQSATWGHSEAPPGSVVKVQFGRLAVTKVNDSTSAALALAGATGQPFKEVKLEMLTNVGGTKVVTNRLKLAGARIVGYQTSGHDGGSPPIDNISFSFDSITWINFKLDSAGRQSPGSAGCYNLKANTTCTPSF